MELEFLRYPNDDEEDPSKRISFGTRAKRPTYPDEIPHDRFGNEHNPNRGVRDVGPGQYENHIRTAFTNQTKPMSLHGYVLGARTAQRNFYSAVVRAPSPTHYQHTENPRVRPLFKPFNQSDKRFKSVNSEYNPGPGAYEHFVQRNRNVQMLHTFGGRTKSVPHVEIKCTIYNMLKCEGCSETPAGDFYSYKTSLLCSRCYEYNFKWQEKFSRAYLSSFKKTRDCSFMHEHQGTTAVIQKISDKELRKLKQKEAYLSLYWP